MDRRLGVIFNGLFVALLRAERRIDPYVRPWFDRFLRRPVADVVQALIVRRRRPPVLPIAAEQQLPGEAETVESIIEEMSAFTRNTYPSPPALRAGNTKTYGAVRATFEVLDGLPAALRHGILERPTSFPAWVRFGGPGPLAPPDMDDNGVLSIGVKLMGVPGPKLLDDERFTQDLTGISAPTFTTPDVVENLKLQQHVRAGTPALYFFDPRDSHLLDAIMQGLWSRTHASPLETPYFSCVAYLLGEGRAMHYAFRPRSPARSKVPRRPSDDYLREAMARTLADHDVELDFLVQLQTDSRRMPIEDASIEWPERLSPFVPVARLTIPAQRFDSADQLEFAEALSFNPWHAIAEHRPLGNQNRARKRIYDELSTLRHTINGTAKREPTGAEVFS